MFEGNHIENCRIMNRRITMDQIHHADFLKGKTLQSGFYIVYFIYFHDYYYIFIKKSIQMILLKTNQITQIKLIVLRTPTYNASKSKYNLPRELRVISFWYNLVLIFLHFFSEGDTLNVGPDISIICYNDTLFTTWTTSIIQ